MSGARSFPFLIALVLCLGPAQPAFSSVFTVTKTADTDDGSCNADCSLREAIIAANARLGPDSVILPAGTYQLTIPGSLDVSSHLGDLDINDDLVLSGSGSAVTVIDANGLDRVLEVGPLAIGISVSVSGVTVRGGNATFGGGIFNHANLTLVLCSVSGNLARNGAGIENAGTLTLTGSTLGNNHATTTQVSDGFGGGLFNGLGATALVQGGSVVGNTSERDGAGLYNIGGSLTVNGGAVLSGNAAQATEGQPLGGGIANASSGPSTAVLQVSNVTLSGNSGDDGGGIANLGGASATLDRVTLSGNQATGTTSLGGGGGLFNVGSTSTMTLAGCTLSQNIALGEGGGGLVSSGSLTVTDSSFDRNEARNHPGPLPPSTNGPGFGGAMLLINGGTTTLTNAILTNNLAGKNGGGIHNDGGSIVHVNGGRIANNTAQSLFGGGIFNQGDLTVTGTAITGNTSGSDGGGLANVAGTATLDSTTVSQNHSGVNGGGIYSLAPLQISLGGVLNNTAAMSGGGLQNEGTATLTGTEIRGNDAPALGGGIFNAAGRMLSLADCVVSGNTTLGDGGGIFNSGTLDLTRVSVSLNMAGSFGGGLENSQGTAGVLDCTFSQNGAANGGALGNFNSGSMSVERSTLSHNTATGSFGGGIHGNSLLSLVNSTVSQNMAPQGGGISATNGASVSLTHTTLTANTASSGSAIWSFASNIGLTNSLVDGSCVGGTFASLGGNLESPGNTCGLSDASDLTGVTDPGLGPLAANGGNTQTHALLPGSPALNSAQPPCPATDQRGVVRPAAGCDIGAVEGLPEPGVFTTQVVMLAALAVLITRRRMPR